MLRCHALVSARYRTKAWATESPHLFRRRPDATLATNSFEEAHAAIVVDDVLQSGVDRLCEGLGAKDLLYSVDFLAVDEERGLVLFGYLFCHSVDILDDSAG